MPGSRRRNGDGPLDPLASRQRCAVAVPGKGVTSKHLTDGFPFMPRRLRAWILHGWRRCGPSLGRNDAVGRKVNAKQMLPPDEE